MRTGAWDPTDTSDETRTAAVQAVTFMVEKLFEQMDAENKSETVTVIYDRSNFTMGHIKVVLPFVKELALSLQDNYPGRLNAILIYPINWMFKDVWKVAKHMFDADPVSKVQFCSKASDIQSYVDPDNLMVDYGGKAHYDFKFDINDYYKKDITDKKDNTDSRNDKEKKQHIKDVEAAEDEKEPNGKVKDKFDEDLRSALQ